MNTANQQNNKKNQKVCKTAATAVILGMKFHRGNCFDTTEVPAPLILDTCF